MEKEIIAALIGAGAGAFIAWWATSTTNKIQQQIADSNLQLQKNLAEENSRAQRKASLEAMILKMSEFAMQWPTLEKEAYCSAYPKCPGDENGRERYENYCVYVFNVLGAVFEFCKGNKNEIAAFTSAEELILRHYRCWKADIYNLEHDEPFVQYVESVINDLRKKGKIQ